MSAISLKDALLCSNCETIFGMERKASIVACPTCASSNFLILSKILNRQDDKSS